MHKHRIAFGIFSFSVKLWVIDFLPPFYLKENWRIWEFPTKSKIQILISFTKMTIFPTLHYRILERKSHLFLHSMLGKNGKQKDRRGRCVCWWLETWAAPSIPLLSIKPFLVWDSCRLWSLLHTSWNSKDLSFFNLYCIPIALEILYYSCFPRKGLIRIPLLDHVSVRELLSSIKRCSLFFPWGFKDAILKLKCLV